MTRYRILLDSWTITVPIIGVAALVAFTLSAPQGLALALAAVLLAASVLAAVHHAEVIAHRVGEPFGSLVLALAVTVIEVALIVTLILAGGPETATLARDTVFAAVMITCTGIVGLSLLVATLHHRTASFNAEGTASALATLATLAVLALVLPAFTTSRILNEYSGIQLVFAAVGSTVLYLLFVLNQTVRHRDYFLPVGEAAKDPEQHALPPTRRSAMISFGMLIVALVAVVGLAKVESKPLEDFVRSIDAPAAAVGVLIALLVLAPETLAAVRNGQRDRMQNSFNLALGSSMAAIGLTIPAIAIASIWIPNPIVLGLEPIQMALLAIALFTTGLTVLPGRATLQAAGVHLIVFLAFIFFAFNP